MINVEHVSKTFKVSKRNAGFKEACRAFVRKEYQIVKALDDISFSISEGDRRNCFIYRNFYDLCCNLFFYNRRVRIHECIYRWCQRIWEISDWCIWKESITDLYIYYSLCFNTVLSCTVSTG